jgi:hypothetical protein
MLYLKEKTSYVFLLWLILVIISSYKLGIMGAVSTVYGFMLLALVIILSILATISIITLIIIQLIYIKRGL